MKAAVIRFPGSNCDFDMLYALQDFGIDAEILSADNNDLNDFDAVFLPGGFAYGGLFENWRHCKVFANHGGRYSSG